VRVQRFGPRALCLEPDDPTRREPLWIARLAAVIEAASADDPRLAAVEEAVPGFDVVVVHHRAGADVAALEAGLRAGIERRGVDLEDEARATRAARLHTIEVVYDGEDLPVVAEALGLDTAAVIALHAAPTYAVEVLGFMPGFAYLGGLDARLRLGRRSAPRTRVPAGAVAIAESRTAIYPRESPGGWHLLGTARLAEPLFDAHRTPPARLLPGDSVRFLPVTP
jgi:KipI family sensor histidine kinase inhibitor